LVSPAALGCLALAVTLACTRSPALPSFDHPLVLGGRTVPPEDLRQGAEAYVHYCRPCHGDQGDGAGQSAAGLDPPPRDLRLGAYKFAAVAAGQLPNDDDLRRIIKGGLHGTAMLSWDVPDRELDHLIQYIKSFSPRWRTEKPGEAIVLDPDPWTAKDNREAPEREAAAIDRGRRVYHGLAQCAVACHPAYATRAEIFAFAQELTGLRVDQFRSDLYDPVPKPSDYGTVILPPDFTFHPLRAGDTTTDIARAVAAGIGGTAMPTWKNVLPDGDLWAMAHYVRSLVALRATAEADRLRTELLAAPPWTPPPPPATDGGVADGLPNLSAPPSR